MGSGALPTLYLVRDQPKYPTHGEEVFPQVGCFQGTERLGDQYLVSFPENLLLSGLIIVLLVAVLCGGAVLLG